MSERYRYRHGLANNLMLFFGSIAFAALLIAVFNSPIETIAAAGADVTSSQQAATGQRWIEQFWSATPFIVVALGLIQLLGAAAVEAKTP